MTIFNMVGWGSWGGWWGWYKSYAELKAMTLSDVIEELNTDAQWYYNNLNGNWHIIGIWIANDDRVTYQCWGVSPVIFWDWSWRDGEIIIAKIKTDSSGNLMIPKAWYSLSIAQNASYNWWVSYDGWSETQYSWTGSAGSITIASWLTPDTEHTIVIRPNSESYGWARAFGFYNSWVQGLLTEVIYDWSYEWYSSSSTATGNYFRYFQYRWCIGLTTAPQEVLPSTVTSIGGSFRYNQYFWCTGLTTAPQEILPSSVTSISDRFRYSQYNWCTSLTTASQEVLPSSVTSIGGSFRYNQYYWCTSLTIAPQEVLPNSITSIGSEFRNAQYRWCTSLTTASQEVLPSSVTSIGNYFRTTQYRWCTSLTTAPQEVLPSSVTSIGSYFRSSQYNWCTLLKEIQWMKDLSVGDSNYRLQQFYDCNSMKIVKVLSDVWYVTTSNNNVLSNNYVSVVLVPSAYLQNFKDATTYPRRWITDSKFIWY